MKRTVLIPAGILTVTALAWSGDRWCGRPVRKYCHLPCYDYRGRPPSNPVSQTTTAAINLTAEEVIVDPLERLEAGPGAAGTRTLKIKTFQLADSEIRNDCCRLSQVSITICEDGTWIVNAVAEQNPDFVDEVQRPRFFNFKRNRFYVDVRGVGLATALDPPATRVLGQPQFCHLEFDSFWIEARQKRVMRWTGTSKEIDNTFTLVDRIDVDLRYE